MRTDPQVSNVLGKDNLDSTFDQRFSFHHGHVDQVIMTPQDLDDAGITIDPESVDSVSQLIVFTPSYGDDEGFNLASNFLISPSISANLIDCFNFLLDVISNPKVILSLIVPEKRYPS